MRGGGSGLAGIRIPLRRRAHGPAGAPPLPFRPHRGNRLPAQVLSFEASNEAFQKFFKLPVPALTGAHSSSSLHPATAAGKRGCRGAGLRLWDPSAAQERQAQPGVLGDPAQEPDLGGSASSEGEGKEGLREEKRQGAGRGSRPHYQGSCAGFKPRDYLNWPLGKAAGDLCPRPLSSP